MKIIGAEGLSHVQLQEEISRGARFVFFQYCISVGIMTFKRPSSIYYVPAGKSTVGKSLPFTLISLLLGWWGIPWGPIYTISSMVTNIGGGENVTAQIMASATRQVAPSVPMPKAPPSI